MSPFYERLPISDDSLYETRARLDADVKRAKRAKKTREPRPAAAAAAARGRKLLETSAIDGVDLIPREFPTPIVPPDPTTTAEKVAAAISAGTPLPEPETLTPRQAVAATRAALLGGDAEMADRCCWESCQRSLW